MDQLPTNRRLFASFFRLGLTAFGGPAMIAHLRELSVTRNKWLDEKTFDDGVILSQSLPGATVVQAATYVGFRLKGIPGALTSFIGFVLPAFILILILSSFYASYHEMPRIVSLFSGLQIVVVAIVSHSLYLLSSKAVRTYREIAIALAAAMLFLAEVSPFIVIAGAAVIGLALYKDAATVLTPLQKSGNYRHVASSLSLLLAIPLVITLGLFLMDRDLYKLAVLMMKIDLFAFGGGFASIPLMLHEIVNVQGWMNSATFMDGIALGQVTPGPIVLTATYVGYLVHGIAGAVVATIAIFTPSFVLLVIATPFFDKLKHSMHFLRATKGILASFIGLLLFVAVKFAVAVPWDTPRALLALAVVVGLTKKVDILYVVLASAACSLFLF